MTIAIQTKFVPGDGVSKIHVSRWVEGLGGVANITALSAIDTDELPDIFEVRVQTTYCPWELRKSSTATVDGITVAATPHGTGRWHRLDIDSDTFSIEPNIYIDEALGSDENDGLTAGTPLASVAEYMRRVAGRVIAQNVTVHVTGSLSEHVVDVTLYKSYIRFAFTPTTTRTGTISAVNLSNASAKTLADIADAGVSDWTPDRQCMLVNTTAGARQNASCWVLKNTQSGNQITTKWAKSIFSAPTDIPTATPANVGDTYAVKALPTCAVAMIVATGDLSSAIVYDGCDLTGNAAYGLLATNSGPIVYFFNCRVTASTRFNSDVYFVNSLANNGIEMFARGSDSWAFCGGLSTGPANMSATTPSNGCWVASGAKFTLSDDVAFDQVRGILVRPGGHVVVRDGAGFRRGGSNVANGHWGSHIVVKDGGIFESFGAPVYGSGSTRRGLSADPGAHVSFEQEPKLTGDLAGGDFECEKVDQARAYDATTDTYSSLISATFANLFATQGAGGFGGQAHFKEYGLTIYRKVSFP